MSSREKSPYYGALQQVVDSLFADLTEEERIADMAGVPGARKVRRLDVILAAEAVDLPDELVIIPMDAILIEQVIINILENAVQHAEGMKNLALNVKCNGDRVVFEVQDGSLLGDSSDEVSADCRPRRNAGIGLSVCATIIKAHGGDISAYNSAEGGAVFRFTLKIEEVTDEQ